MKKKFFVVLAGIIFGLLLSSCAGSRPAVSSLPTIFVEEENDGTPINPNYWMMGRKVLVTSENLGWSFGDREVAEEKVKLLLSSYGMEILEGDDNRWSRYTRRGEEKQPLSSDRIILSLSDEGKYKHLYLKYYFKGRDGSSLVVRGEGRDWSHGGYGWSFSSASMTERDWRHRAWESAAKEVVGRLASRKVVITKRR